MVCFFKGQEETVLFRTGVWPWERRFSAPAGKGQVIPRKGQRSTVEQGAAGWELVPVGGFETGERDAKGKVSGPLQLALVRGTATWYFCI